MTVGEAIKEAIKHAEGVMDENLEMTKEEALEQQPCDDCVSRQAVLDALNKTSGIRGDALKALYDLPPVTPQTRWIPVSSGKLPNFNDIVLASTDSDYDELRVILTVYNAEEFWFNGKIKAWMPLPKPYKAESEE